MTNKQRITKLSKKEKHAANSGGVLDDAIDAVSKRLENEAGRNFDSEAIIERLAHSVGLIRLFKTAEKSRLEPKEVAKQASQTAAVIDELVTRFQNIHPELQVPLDDYYSIVHGFFFFQVLEGISPDLRRIQAILKKSAAEIRNQENRPGPKTGRWQIARNDIADALIEYSKPKLSKKAAKEVAAELLELSGEPSPRKK